MITEETIARVKFSLQATKSFVTLEVIEHLESQIDCYKALDSHYEEIEEDSKAIAQENEQLKSRLKKAKEMLPAYLSEKI